MVAPDWPEPGEGDTEAPLAEGSPPPQFPDSPAKARSGEEV
jgi:hypothetical protein